MSTKDLNNNVHSSIIPNSPKLETTQISHQQVNGETVVYLHNGILLRNKRNKLLTDPCSNIDES